MYMLETEALAIRALSNIGTVASPDMVLAVREWLNRYEKAQPEVIPAWCQIPDEHAETLIELEMDIIRDDLKHYAQSELDKLSMREVVTKILEGSIDPDAPDPTDEDVDLWIKENME